MVPATGAFPGRPVTNYAHNVRNISSPTCASLVPSQCLRTVTPLSHTLAGRPQHLHEGACRCAKTPLTNCPRHDAHRVPTTLPLSESRPRRVCSNISQFDAKAHIVSTLRYVDYQFVRTRSALTVSWYRLSARRNASNSRCNAYDRLPAFVSSSPNTLRPLGTIRTRYDSVNRVHAVSYLRPAPKTHHRPALRRRARAPPNHIGRLMHPTHTLSKSQPDPRRQNTRDRGWFHGRRHRIQLRPATDMPPSRPVPAHRSASTPFGTMATARTFITGLDDLAQPAASVLWRDDRDFAHLRAPAPRTSLPGSALRLAHCTHPEFASGTFSTRPLANCADDIGFSYAPATKCIYLPVQRPDRPPRLRAASREHSPPSTKLSPRYDGGRRADLAGTPATLAATSRADGGSVASGNETIGYMRQGAHALCVAWRPGDLKNRRLRPISWGRGRSQLTNARVTPRSHARWPRNSAGTCLENLTTAPRCPGARTTISAADYVAAGLCAHPGPRTSRAQTPHCRPLRLGQRVPCTRLHTPLTSWRDPGRSKSRRFDRFHGTAKGGNHELVYSAPVPRPGAVPRRRHTPIHPPHRPHRSQACSSPVPRGVVASGHGCLPPDDHNLQSTPLPNAASLRSVIAPTLCMHQGTCAPRVSARSEHNIFALVRPISWAATRPDSQLARPASVPHRGAVPLGVCTRGHDCYCPLLRTRAYRDSARQPDGPAAHARHDDVDLAHRRLQGGLTKRNGGLYAPGHTHSPRCGAIRGKKSRLTWPISWGLPRPESRMRAPRHRPGLWGRKTRHILS